MEYHPESEYCKVFCLRHRPFPLLKEIERNEKLQEDEIIHFCELFDNSLFEYKNLKRWSDRDKKELLAKVQSLFFQLRKLQITLYKGQSQLTSQEAMLPMKRKSETYYIRAGRYFDNPKEWTVTLTRKGFPWRECMFKNYNSRDCHLMYKELIQSEDSFIRKVVGERYQHKYE